jgi:hypothetical protein
MTQNANRKSLKHVAIRFERNDLWRARRKWEKLRASGARSHELIKIYYQIEALYLYLKLSRSFSVITERIDKSPPITLSHRSGIAMVMDSLFDFSDSLAI